MYNKVPQSLIVVLAVLLVCLSFSGRAGAVTPEQSNAALREGKISYNPASMQKHPWLLIDASQLKAVRAEWQKNPGKYAVLADERGFGNLSPVPINQDINGWHLPRRMLLSTVLYLITGDQRHAENVHKWIQNSYAPVFVENPAPIVIPSLGTDNKDLAVGGLLYSTALMYDLLAASESYREKYPGDVAILEKTLLIQGAQTYKDVNAIAAPWYEQNHFYITAGGLGLAAMALADKLGDYPEIADWAVWSRNAMRRTTEALSSDGFYYEGIGYWSGFFHYATVYAEALNRLTGEDLRKPGADNSPGLFTGLVEYLAHVRLPEAGKFVAYADHGPREAYQGYRLFMSDLKVPMALPAVLQMAEMNPSPLVRHVISAEWKSRGEFEQISVDAMESSLVLLKLPVLAESLASEADISKVPSWHYFSNHDAIFWRNGWTGKDAVKGTHLFIKSGPPEGHKATNLLRKYPDWKMGMGHVHQDAGSFQIYAQGAHLVTAPGFSGEKKTEHHSCVLIDGKGQYNEGLTWDSFHKAPYAKYDPMRFENVWLSSQVAAGTAIIEAAYDDALRLKYYHREFIMIAGRWLVMRDALEAPDPHQYTWVIQSDRPFVPDGNSPGARWYSVVKNGRIIVQSLVPLEDSEIAPTLINVDLAGTRPEYVVREQNLKLHLPKTRQCEILTALCIQPRESKPESFKPAVVGKGMVEIVENDERCTIYMGESPRLDGVFGFAWTGPGGTSYGLSGTRLALPDGKIMTLDQPGKVTLTWTAGRCKMESDMKVPAKLSISETGKNIITLQVPEGSNVQMVEIKL